MPSQKEFKHYLISTIELFNSLVKYALEVQSEVVVIDVETDSEIEKKANLYGIGLAYTANKSFYIPFRKKDSSKYWNIEEEKQIVQWLTKELPNKKILAHNGIYDILVIDYNLNLKLDPYIYHDTILSAHTTDESRDSFALKELAPKILGEWAIKGQEQLKENVLANGGKWVEGQKDMYLADTEVLAEYCCYDCILTLLLYEHFDKELEKEGLKKLFYEEEVMPLYREVTINMKRKGFHIDTNHFNNLKEELQDNIERLEKEILKELNPWVKEYEQSVLDKKYPIKATGSFVKKFAELNKVELPINPKTGAVTLAEKAILEIKEENKSDKASNDFYTWILEKSTTNDTYYWVYDNRRETQEALFFENNPEEKYIFNLNSGDHLGYILYTALDITPKVFTKGGKPSTTAAVIEEIIEKYKDQTSWAQKLYDLKKLSKLLSTYVMGILDRQIDGVIYASMLQFGTTSGRFSSRNPNLQNLPRIKDEDSNLSELVLKYVNEIKKGFIAPKGYKIVNADYSTLEPRSFAAASGSKELQAVFFRGEDLYSKIAIDIFKLKNCSAYKKDINYVGKLYPEYRQTVKVFSLATVYGASPSRIAQLLDKPYRDAANLIDLYLDAYPDLKKYMNKCDYLAKTKGCVKTDFGRIRHLNEASIIYYLYSDKILDYKWASSTGKEDIRRRYKNLLNNAKNFPIQGLAAHIVNRALIATSKSFIENNIDGFIINQIHDEITCLVRDDQALQAATLLKNCMENTTKIAVPLIAEPIIADNLANAK